MSSVDELKQQLADLGKLVESERKQHSVAAQEANDRIRNLEERLIAADQKKTASQKTGVQRPQTASKKGVTVNGVARPATANGTKAPSAAGSSTPMVTPKAKFSSRSNGEAKQLHLTNGSTALQHAWDKFCVTAREDFTPKELSLMSLETIKSLVQHYGYSNPVEIAQIEAQWALIQDGEKAVVAPTPHVTTSNRARSFSPMPVKTEFDLRTTVLKPHLSKRSLISPDPPKSSNPMGSCDHHPEPRPQSKGATLKEAPLSSNPNEHSPDRSQMHPEGKRTSNLQNVFTHKVYPRGKSRSHSPDPKTLTTYPQESGPEPRLGGQKLAEVAPPWPRQPRGHGLKMVTPLAHEEPKKRSIRIVPQKDQIVIG